MNNGGSSALFSDFTPSRSGKPGQIIRFLHNPDELIVIADSFNVYLQLTMDKGHCIPAAVQTLITCCYCLPEI